jgi:uridylate kinase
MTMLGLVKQGLGTLKNTAFHRCKGHKIKIWIFSREKFRNLNLKILNIR